MAQDDFRDLYKKINHKWNDSVSIYKELVKKYINQETVILEAGCGFSNMYKEEYKRAKKVIGVDIDSAYLEANDTIQEKIVADLSSFPQVPNSSVDLIISSWVLEHLKDPQKVFAEFSRVLKSNGRIIFITPNSLNYIVVLNRLIPKILRNRVARLLTKNLTVDPMPAFYQANTVIQINTLSKTNKLKVENLILNGDPTYVAINRVFFYIGIFIEQILNLPILNKTKVHIIGVVIKP